MVEPFKLESYYIQKVFVNDSIDLFALSVESFPRIEHHLFLYNNNSSHYVKTNIVINGKWSKNNEEGFNYKLLEYPLCNILNLDGKLFFQYKKEFIMEILIMPLLIIIMKWTLKV